MYNISDTLDFNDQGSYIIKKGKIEFLTLMELRLLNYFIENKNTRISSEEIALYLETFSAYPTNQNVYVYINRLRRKIECNPNDPQLLLNLRPDYIFFIRDNNAKLIKSL